MIECSVEKGCVTGICIGNGLKTWFVTDQVFFEGRLYGVDFYFSPFFHMVKMGSFSKRYIRP